MGDEDVLVDTWGWLALADSGEPRHRPVHDLLASLWRRRLLVVTTDYVLDETFTLVFRRLAFSKGRRFVAAVEAGERDGSLRLEWVGPERFAGARQLRLRFRDKPRISFTDLTSMVVMNELGISRVITADDHFRQVGLGFEPVP